jgi:uncharacterized membrane protein
VDRLPLDRLEELERRLAALDGRLERVEAALARQAPAVPVPAGAPPPKAPVQPARSAPPPAAPPSEPISLEDLLGGRVLAWVGAAAVVLGVVFFLVMAASRGWIDEPTRILLALVGSSALLFAGLLLHEREGRTQAALAASATAIASLDLTIVAATQLYDLVAPELGLFLAGLVGAVATAIAVRWAEPVVAGIGIVGALLAPVLVDAGTSGVTLVFLALALASAVGVLLWQRWSWLGMLAFALSLPQLLAWLGDGFDGSEDPLALRLAVLTGFWLLYVIAAIGYELRVPTAALRLTSASLLLADAALLAGAGWLLLDDGGHETAATAWVIGAAALYIGGGVPAWRGRMSREIAALLVAVGTALAAVGLALALDGPILVAGWAAEAIVLAWAGRRLGDPRGQVAAFAFFVLAAGHALTIEAPPEGLRLALDDFSSAAVAVVIVGLTAAALARLARDAEAEEEIEPGLGQLYAAVAAAAAVYLPSLAIVAAFGGDSTEAGQTPQVLLSAFWACTGLAGLVVGLIRDLRLLRLGALALLGLAVAKVFLYDLSELDSIYRAVSFIALGLLLLGGAFAYQRIRRELRS